MNDLPTDFETVERIIRSRRATRRFRSDPIPQGLLDRLVDLARWAPSGYNLQPTHFVVVTEPAIKAKLHRACLKQRQVLEAPALMVVTGDGHVARNHFDQVLRMDREASAITPEYERMLRRTVPLAFGRGPLGIGWLWKAALLPVVRLFRPIPDLPAVHKRYWLAKPTMLCAMNLMLAAEAAGLATSPMEGFDATRVRKVLGIPPTHDVPVIIAIGYGEARPPARTRVPLEGILHRDRW